MRKVISDFTRNRIFAAFMAMAIVVLVGVPFTLAVQTSTSSSKALSTDVNEPFTKGMTITLPNGDTATSDSFRIPSMVTLADGTIVAAADVRWNTTYDGGGLDTIVARSTDNGVSWSYELANYLGDNGNAFSSNSSAFIDPSLTVGHDGTLYMLVDLYPYGVALNGGLRAPTASSGFDDNGNLWLSADDNATYGYYLNLSDYKIYPAGGGDALEGYTVDKYFNISYEKDGATVESNLFFANSPFKVTRTGFLYLTKSYDGGASWSEPALLNVPRESQYEQVTLVAPGRGITTSDGKIVFPVYSYSGDNAASGNSQRMSFIYSTDGGDSWQRTAPCPVKSAFYQAEWTSESAAVEIEGGTLRFFARNGLSKLSYADYTFGSGWTDLVSTDIAVNSNTQLSAISYSETYDGKQVILVSCPTGPNGEGSNDSNGASRLNGHIFAGVVEDDSSMTWIGDVDVSGANAVSQISSGESVYTAEQGFFSYSCLTERSDGSVAILFENNQIGWGAGDGFYFTMDMKAYTPADLGLTVDKVTGSVDDVFVTATGSTLPLGAYLSIQRADQPDWGVVYDVVERDVFDWSLTTLTPLDLSIMKDGAPWRPDEPVKVTLTNMWDTESSDPVVDVYHLLDTPSAIQKAQEEGTLLTCSNQMLLDTHPEEVAAAQEAGLEGVVAYVLLSSRGGDVDLNEDGSITFEADSFSDFWVVSGTVTSVGNLQNGTTHTLYMVAGSSATATVQSTSSVSATSSNSNVAKSSSSSSYGSTTITISADANARVGDTATVTVSWKSSNKNRSAKLNVQIVSQDEYEAHKWEDKFTTSYPVYLAVRQNGQIPGEPSVQGESGYSFFNSSYQQITNSWSPYFANSADGIISTDIVNHDKFYDVSADGSRTVGMVDATGLFIKDMVTGVNWDSLLNAVARSRGVTATDGKVVTTQNVDNYVVVPYVVKLQEDNGTGWHIDCAIVPKNVVTLSYDINIPLGYQYTASDVGVPNAQTAVAPADFTVGKMDGLKTIDGEANAIKVVSATDSTETYVFMFQGWNTKPDGSGTWYQAGDPMEDVTTNTVLYAIWDSNPALGSGNLMIEKEVVVGGGILLDEHLNQLFEFQVTVAGGEQGKEYEYRIFGSNSVTISSGKLVSGGTVELKHGQYAVVYDLPAVNDADGAPNVTVSEAPMADCATSWEDGTVSGNATSVKIEGGRRSEVLCTNTFEAPKATLTIVKKAFGTEEISKDETFVFIVEGVEGTATEGVSLDITINGVGSATVSGLPMGDYTVTEDVDWSWRYAVVDANGLEKSPTVNVTLDEDGETATFVNSLFNGNWIGDTTMLLNLFDGSVVPTGNSRN